MDILIWGGTTIVGVFAIQLAKASGCRVLTTCGTKNMAYEHGNRDPSSRGLSLPDLRSHPAVGWRRYAMELGADVVVDYTSPTCLADLKAAAPQLHYAFDTVGNPTCA